MEIREVLTKKDYKLFLNFPLEIYSEDSVFVMPLFQHTKMMIGKLGRGKKHLFLVLDSGKVVARLGVKVHKHEGVEYLHFGFYESLEVGSGATKELFNHVHALYPELPMRGPYHFRMEDPFIGVLVDGFEESPCFLMPYNPAYYDDYLKSAELTVSMDLVTYSALSRPTLGEDIDSKAAKALGDGYQVRWLNPKKMKQEVRTIARIFNEALSGNWGFEEMLDQQVKEMYLLFKLFLDPKIILFVQKDGEDVACLILLPDFNPMVKKNRGRLTLPLLYKLLFKKKQIDAVRGYALVVLKSHHGHGIGSLLIQAVNKRCREELGIVKGEISWILSNNDSMNALAKNLQGKPNKTYRIYDRSISK